MGCVPSTVARPPASPQLLRKIEAARTTGNLDLTNEAIDMLPDECTSFKVVRQVNITGTRIATLAAVIQPATDGCRSLSAKGAKLRGPQPSLEHMKQLHKLELAGNQLQLVHLPALPRGLKEVDLSGNPLHGFPGLSILPCSAGLQRLHLSGCGITKLPVALTQLKSLQQLELDDNQLTSLQIGSGVAESVESVDSSTGSSSSSSSSASPEVTAATHNSWADLPHLTVLTVRRNRLACTPAAFPRELWESTALKRLQLEGNSAVTIRVLRLLPGFAAYERRFEAAQDKAMHGGALRMQQDASRLLCGLDG